MGEKADRLFGAAAESCRPAQLETVDEARGSGLAGEAERMLQRARREAAAAGEGAPQAGTSPGEGGVGHELEAGLSVEQHKSMTMSQEAMAKRRLGGSRRHHRADPADSAHRPVMAGMVGQLASAKRLGAARANPAAKAMRAELMPLRMSELVQRSWAAGIDRVRVDAAQDDDAPKEALVELLVEHATRQQSAGAAAGGGPPPPAVAADVEYFYLDEEGAEQGPFSFDQMRTWFESGSFPRTLRVAKENMDTGALSRRR